MSLLSPLKICCIDLHLIILFPILAVDVINRRVLFEIWNKEADKEQRNTRIFSHILNHFGLEEVSETVAVNLKGKIRNMCYKFSERWAASNRQRERFLKKNAEWLDGNIVLPELKTYIKDVDDQPSTSTGSGKFRKQFEEVSEKTKRRRVQNLLDSTPPEELIYAAQATLHSSGKRDAASLLKEMVSTSPKRATHIKQSFYSPSSTPNRKLSNEEALATFMDGKLSKRAYVAIQQRLKSVGVKVFPSYPLLLQARKDCYPENISVSEVSAEINLQSLIDHTTRRILQAHSNNIVPYKNDLDNVELVFKWGCDGTSGFSPYKQRFTEQDTAEQEDNAMFVISIVPLELRSWNNKTKLVLWQNSTPSSTRYCRPIKLVLKAESSELIKLETHNIERQVSRLNPTTANIEEREISVTSILLFTMVDGKICNTLLDVSSQKCYICGCSPKEMNNRENVSVTKDNPESYKFGLSPLHARIRFFECLLHIAYRLDIKKWQARGEDKILLQNRKKIIQEKFKTEMGLIVDMVRPGYGTSNDGNTARRFFENSVLSSSITGIDESIIKDFSVLLNAMSCKHEINPEAFQNYAEKALENYLDKYSWYFMPPTVHKVLFHGSVIIKHALLPIGQLSEDAQECRHKEIKKFREHHSRKYSRKATMEDVMNMLLISSDPLINSLRRKESKPLKKLQVEVLTLLQHPPSSMSSSESGSEDDLISSSESE